MVAPGTLYLVPTPIGNLDDITKRAIDVLRDVDIIAAEDTRHSQKLMQHLTLSTPLMAVHEHNEAQRAASLIAKLQNGESIALISDAGTPLISDPGYTLVSQCRENGVDVIALPGPCAAITALSASGLATDRFTFAGFLPVKEGARRQALAELKEETATTVFYEAPRRVVDTVKYIGEELGDRQIVIAKELTKTFEQYVSGDAQKVLAWFAEDNNREKGEFVLMVAGASKRDSEIPAEVETLLLRIAKELPLKKAAAIVADVYGLKKNTLYQLGLELQGK